MVRFSSFTPALVDNDTWEAANIRGFVSGDWTWTITAQDTARKGGNTANSTIHFTVDLDDSDGGGSGGGSSDAVSDAPWETEGAIKTRTGRLFFEMPGNPKRKGPWGGYVCSGSVVDTAEGRSIILTAAHCVYDDVNKAFARNVLFIPNQDATTGAGTDRDCSNDPLGCWVADFAVVDTAGRSAVFPTM
ncbi:MAG: hypothetical protein R3E89_08145 [Thiolinea sp.]